MAHVLIGWELGAFRGHATRMLRLGQALVDAGHTVDLAGQRLDLLRPLNGQVWQAPVWPRLLVGTPRPPAATPATLGDILARLGLGDPDILSALIRGWETILAAAQPDIVIAEYAPVLLATARGRLPTIASGNGFDTPPAGMRSFPSLLGQPPTHDERATLAAVNACLALVDRPLLATLPALFAADRTVATSLEELDPYALFRPEPLAAPLLDQPLGPLAPAEQEELFVYWPAGGQGTRHLWDAIIRTGLPVRAYLPGLEDADRATLAAQGFIIEAQPVSWPEIARRSRLCLSHGGTGFVLSGLIHGRPQVIVHADLEKAGNGIAVDRLQLGGTMQLGDFDTGAFARGLVELHADPTLAVRAQGKAAEFRARTPIPAETLMVQAVADLT